MSSNLKHTTHTSVNATLLLCGLLHNRDTIVAYYASWKAISPSKLVSNGYISNHNKRWRPHLKVKVSFYWYFCCFCIHFTQINIENSQNKCKASLLIVVFIWNRKWILLLERPLSTTELPFKASLCPNIINFDNVDFSERRLKKW